MIDDLIQQFDNSDPFDRVDQETRDRMAKMRAEKVFAGASVEEREAVSPPPSLVGEFRVFDSGAEVEKILDENQKTAEEILSAHDAVIKSLYAELDQAKSERDQAIAQVAIMKAKSNGSDKVNPDGSLTLMVTINPDLVGSLTPWEELEGTGIKETARKYIPVALEAYINGGS